MLKVYEHNESVCCQKVRIVLEEKNIDHETINISFKKREQHSPAFEALNPKGQVPVIDHDGRIITESTIIVEYLDETFPGPQLMPSEPYWRARRRFWARRIDDEMHIPHISTISFNISFTELLEYDQNARAPGARGGPPPFMFAGIESDTMKASLLAYMKFLREIDSALADSDWLAGPRFSLADIDVIPYVWRLRNLHLSGMWREMPRVEAWLQRVSARPSFQKTIVETALPDWIQSMNDRGEKAWPTIERMLELRPVEVSD